MADYDKGDIARITASVRDEDGEPTDPTTAVFTATSPEGDEVRYELGQDAQLEHDDEGEFHVDLTPEDSGWWTYRWEFTGVAQGAEEGSFYVREPGPGILPRVSEIASMLRARTKDQYSNETGQFTDATRPTGQEVERLIHQAAADVTSRVGSTFASDDLERSARHLVTLRAAMLVELSYFPEQLRPEHSAYEHYKDLYDDGMKALAEAVAESGAGGGGASVAGAGLLPSGSFPAALPLEW